MEIILQTYNITGFHAYIICSFLEVETTPFDFLINHEVAWVDELDRMNFYAKKRAKTRINKMNYSYFIYDMKV